MPDNTVSSKQVLDALIERCVEHVSREGLPIDSILVAVHGPDREWDCSITTEAGMRDELDSPPDMEQLVERLRNASWGDSGRTIAVLVMGGGDEEPSEQRLRDQVLNSRLRENHEGIRDFDLLAGAELIAKGHASGPYCECDDPDCLERLPDEPEVWEACGGAHGESSFVIFPDHVPRIAGQVVAHHDGWLEVRLAS